MGGADDTKDPMLALVRAEASAVGNVDKDVDHDLVVRAQRGDQAAFSALYRRHHGRVFGMCARLLKNRADVDDAVQQTFLEAWRCLHRFEGKSRFSTWLTRVAIHTSFSLRRRMRRLLLSDDESQALTVVAGGKHDAGPAIAAEGPLAPDEVATRHAHAQALGEVLQQISEKKRIVFVLADLEDLTSPEVAEILEIPENTVRTRLFYARKEVAALLRAHPAFVDVVGAR